MASKLTGDPNSSSRPGNETKNGCGVFHLQVMLDGKHVSFLHLSAGFDAQTSSEKNPLGEYWQTNLPQLSNIQSFATKTEFVQKD